VLQYTGREKGIPCDRQDEYEIWYKDRLVGKQRLDIFVAGEVVVELKVAERIERIHLAQLLSYLKTVGKRV
jgi:GxxExxY protein